MQCWCENRWKTATKGPNVNIEYPLFFSLWKSSFHKHDALLGNFFQQRVFLLSFFFFFFSSSYLFDAAQVLHTFLRYYYRDINIRMTEKDMINELENSLVISVLFIVWYYYAIIETGKLSINYPS